MEGYPSRLYKQFILPWHSRNVKVFLHVFLPVFSSTNLNFSAVRFFRQTRGPDRKGRFFVSFPDGPIYDEKPLS